MSSVEIKRKLFDYIRDADNRKVKAIYTMVEKKFKRIQLFGLMNLCRNLISE